MIGKTISHYKILEKLGEGGMGVVYKAEDLKLKRIVALKFLPPDLTRDFDAKERFIQEARAASALDHPNICTIHEIDESPDGQMFICMACYEGRSLKEIIGDGPLDITEAADIAVDIARGLAKAHERGITHRDIKPANILITTDERVKVVDFGLAKLTGQTRITKTGTTVGTAAYMSPEQLRGEEVDHRTDIWALGVVLFEMITGTLPFKGDYEPALTYSILNETPLAMTSLRSDTPPDMQRIVEKMLARDVFDRYQQVADVISELESFKTQTKSGVATGAKVTEEIPSIAVLPFVNMSPDPENAYFGDGLAEELINALTHLKGMRVAARTSAFRFRGRDIDIREIGQKLNVRTVLEGSVRRAGNRLRVTAQLINIDDGYHIWSERFDREMEDIFAIQDEITASIVEQMEVKLIRQPDEPLVKRYTENLDAYSLYLKGRYHLFTLTPEGWQKSFEYYQKAVDLDPTFAPAYVSLSQIHQSQCFWGDGRPLEEMPRSRAAVEKALELDDDLPLAHAVMAVIRWVFDWDGEGAEKELRRVFELDPTEPFNHVNYSLFLSAGGRHEDALAEAKLAQKLDPLSSVIAAWAAIAPCVAGHYKEAIADLRQFIEIDPDHWQLYQHLCSAYLYASRIDDALAAAEKAVSLSGGASVALRHLASAYYLAGRTAEGDKNLEILVERSKQTYVAPSYFMEIHLARGERDIALGYLEKAVEERDAWLPVLILNPPQTRPTGPEFDLILKPVRR